MRLRHRTTRALVATASAAGLVLALAGCVGGEGDDGPTGPNGYDLGATLGDVEAWVDVSETTGALDVILERSGGEQEVGVCLGGGGAVCILGDVATQPYVVFIGPPGAERVSTLTWNGEALAMTRLVGVPDEVNQVFVAAPPAADPAALSYSFSVAEASGEVVYTQ